jgi:Flp pilus assembly protein TadD
LLGVLGQNAEAEAVLRAATRVDPTFAEAWHNLGDLLDEEGRSKTALRIAPDYANAMFNLALLLLYACAIVPSHIGGWLMCKC